jgi:hypothetical protein
MLEEMTRNTREHISFDDLMTNLGVHV